MSKKIEFQKVIKIDNQVKGMAYSMEDFTDGPEEGSLIFENKGDDIWAELIMILREFRFGLNGRKRQELNDIILPHLKTMRIRTRGKMNEPYIATNQELTHIQLTAHKVYKYLNDPKLLERRRKGGFQPR